MRDEAPGTYNDFIADIFEPKGLYEVDPEGNPIPYELDGFGSADWAVRKRTTAEDHIAANKALFTAELERLTAWVNDANKPHLRSIEYFDGLLRQWHEKQIVANPADEAAWKKEPNKTIKLPGGKIVMRRGSASKVVDEEQFIPWAQANKPEWLRTKYEPVKASIELVTEDGEKVPGVEIKQGELSWKVETS